MARPRGPLKKQICPRLLVTDCAYIAVAAEKLKITPTEFVGVAAVEKAKSVLDMGASHE